MAKTYMLIVVMALLPLTGCGDKAKPGGPGVTNPNPDSPVVADADKTFKLDVPNSISIKQGEVNTQSITISRGKDFAEWVTIKFASLPQGITFEPVALTLAPSAKEVSFTVQAASDALPGDFKIKVNGEPESGPTSSNEIKITVSKDE